MPLISQVETIFSSTEPEPDSTIPVIFQIISVVRSMDLDSQPKPESKLMSLITQIVSLLNSTDFDSLPKPLSNLISFFSRETLEQVPEFSFVAILNPVLYLIRPDPELFSLIRQIVSVVMNPTLKKLISASPQVEGCFDNGKFAVIGQVQEKRAKWSCFVEKWDTFGLKEEDPTYFRCKSCNGEYHRDYEKALHDIQHPLHQKHSLQLALNSGSETRECYCCDEDLMQVFYYCSACDVALNIACGEKPPDLYLPPTKWHEHTLALFPRWGAPLTCNVCALADSSSPIYMCPPCDFVVHLRCIRLPLVLRISRHPHRLKYIPSFEQGIWSCRVCRRNIDNDYGGYSCIKGSCSYAAHSRCATQSNVWDGIDLEGEPEEIEEEQLEPFVRISDGLIQHFSHGHHHLRLDENTGRDYDENMQCQACITPIYFGKFYSCVQCDFILHEPCANLSRKIYHSVHPHPLILAVLGDWVSHKNHCSVCRVSLTNGFVYECGNEDSHFQIHVQCATISEPLVHGSHDKHPLFLTSKPGEWRTCYVCQVRSYETFNCIERDGFALCFSCAVIPQEVRYKHDKHILTLFHGEETSTMTYWCEVCERKINNPKERFYMCDEYCCVTLHIHCLIGRKLYVKPDTSFCFWGDLVDVLPNNHHMTRPICSICKKRCSDKIVFKISGSKLCSMQCAYDYNLMH